MKPYLYSFSLHLLLVLLVVSGLFVWKKTEPEKISAMSASLVTLPKAVHAQSSSAQALPPQSAPPKEVIPPEKQPKEKTLIEKPIIEKPELKKTEEVKKPEIKKTELKKADPSPVPPAVEKPVKPAKPVINSKEVNALMDEENAELKQLEQQVSSNSLEIEQQVVMAQYSAFIKQKVERYWSRPLSAKNNMQVTLHISMQPGGVVKEVTVINSSGNAAFDQSAIQAVERAKTLPAPADLRLFNLYFKSLTLIFRPEDL